MDYKCEITDTYVTERRDYIHVFDEDMLIMHVIDT